jgi:hypothetical protein
VYRDKSHIRLELLGARMPGNLPTSTTFTRVEMEEIRSVTAQVIYAETCGEASNELRNGKKGRLRSGVNGRFEVSFTYFQMNISCPSPIYPAREGWRVF